MQRQVALAADGHAQRSVAEHLQAHRSSVGTRNRVVGDMPVDLGHLLHVQLACQHHHVGPLRVEAYGLDIADVCLRGYMHRYAHPAAVTNGGDVGGDDGGDSGRLGVVHDVVHTVDVGIIQDGVDGQVCPHAGLVAPGGDGLHVGDREVGTAAAAHVQSLDAEVDGIRPCVEGRRQRLPRPHRSHYLKVFSFQCK